MVRFSFTDDELRFAVKVVPRSSQSIIAGEFDGALRVKLAAPPVDGAANEELIRTLAKAFHVPVRSVEIVSGHTSKTKQICVTGGSPARLEQLGSGG